MSNLKKNTQFFFKLPSFQALSNSTRPCGSGSYCNPKDNKQKYIKIQDFELPEAANNLEIEEIAKRDCKLQSNSRRGRFL
jgi:hypothetical protein